MSYAIMNGMQSNRYPLKGLGDSGDGLGCGCGCGGTGGCGGGMGSSEPETVDVKWKWAAMGLGALVVAQFFWWDAKAPQVLRGR